MTWSNVGTFIAGSIAVIASACIGPLYNRLHRLSKEK